MSENTKILFLTNAFPYYPGEQFIESEILFWSNLYPGKVVILPFGRNNEDPREIPHDILVHPVLLRNNFIQKVFGFFTVLTSSLFLKEVLYIFFRLKSLEYSLYKTAFRTTYSVIKRYKYLKNYIEGEKSNIVIYSYWFDLNAYAAALLKRNHNKVTKVITRAHGFDLYENRRKSNYMPLKRQFLSSLDRIYSISQQGKRYLNIQYNFPLEKISVARLGIAINDKLSLPSPDNEFNIMSISNCIPLKRIDKIINAISLLAESKPNIKIKWNHLGEGPEIDKLIELANKKLIASNVKWTFHGQLSNKGVKSFLNSSKLDVMINTSESEGVPVSIMEAMSYGIPAIAPSVGGISELVNETNGILMSENPDVQEIANALANIEFFKTASTRISAHNEVNNNYNAAINYQKFIEEIVS